LHEQTDTLKFETPEILETLMETLETLETLMETPETLAEAFFDPSRPLHGSFGAF
jgi:hypothetical protein